jgi:glycosyltransferase involved in cell wall biosynthesis
MRIAAYYQRVRLWSPTGVGKHILHMTKGLERHFGAVTHIQEFDDLRKSRQLAVPPLQAPAVQFTLPLPRRVLKAAWLKVDQPSLELFGLRPDWVYCPAEDYIATKGAKLAVTIHDLRPFEDGLPWSHETEDVLYRARWQPVLKRIVERADVLLTVSEYSKVRMVEILHVPESKVVVVGNGVEDLFYEASPTGANSEKEDFVLMVGGLQPRKGHAHVMELSRLFKKSGAKTKILVAGRGEPACDAEGKAAGNIELLGYVSDEELRDLMSKAEAFIMLSEYEGFGIPVLEAMAAGCPAIAINRSALPEVVGDAGIVVETAEEAFEAVRSLRSDQNLRHGLIQKGHLRAADFRWSSCVSRLARVMGA